MTTKGIVLRYRGAQSFLSHFHRSEFQLGGETFNCAEQGYQYAKALIEDHLDVAAQILSTDDPLEQKGLSKAIQHQPENCWGKLRWHIMLCLDFERFMQSPRLLRQLLLTHSKTLVEDVPADAYWGGKVNAAGRLIMSIREECFGEARTMPQVVIVSDDTLADFDQGLIEEALDRLQKPKKVLLVSVPGANFQRITTIVRFLTTRATQKVVIVAGTHDLAPPNGHEYDGRRPNRSLAAQMIRFDVDFHELHPKAQLFYALMQVREGQIENHNGDRVREMNNYMLLREAAGRYMKGTSVVTIDPHLLRNHTLPDGKLLPWAKFRAARLIATELSF